MFFVFLGGGYFLATFAFFFPFTIDVLLKYIYIFFFVRVTIYVCSKNSSKVVARSTCEKKNKFDVFKFYLNVRFWAWKKKPQLIAVYIYMYTYFYWFHEMLWSMEYVICVWVYFTFL